VRHLPPVVEPAELLADASRIRTELGWRPERSELRRIVADAYGADEEGEPAPDLPEEPGRRTATAP
jgi:UDP-glucose 4-epimerase